jgi:hypothetical protein
MLPFIQIAKVFEISTKIINNIFLLLRIFGFINPNFLGFRIRINAKKKSEIPRIVGLSDFGFGLTTLLTTHTHKFKMDILYKYSAIKFWY